MKVILKDKNIFARHGLYSIKFLIKFWLIYVGFPMALEIKTKPRVEKLCVGLFVLWLAGKFSKTKKKTIKKNSQIYSLC